MNSEGVVEQCKNTLLVVIYKLPIIESPTILSLTKFIQHQGSWASSGYRLHIWDNSPCSSVADVSVIQAMLPAFEIQYVHTPDNRSLSKIYNEVACKIGENEYLTLFDQDTVLPISYFEELKIAQHAHWPLILPKVECQGELVSPGKRCFARGIRLSDIYSGAINSKNLLAINSGMSILGKVFRLFNYDERLRFYGTDSYFMRNYEKYFDRAFVLDTPISHSLAVMEVKSVEWCFNYNEELIRTFDIIYTNSRWEKLFVRAYVMYLRLKCAMTHCS